MDEIIVNYDKAKNEYRATVEGREWIYKPATASFYFPEFELDGVVYGEEEYIGCRVDEFMEAPEYWFERVQMEFVEEMAYEERFIY